MVQRCPQSRAPAVQARYSLEFARAPSVWSAYPKILLSRKPRLVPEGGQVPRIEARLASVAIDRRHLARYAELCGATNGNTLPVAYPHVLAMPLHLAILGSAAFPVRLFGLVHVRNRIAMRRPLLVDEPGAILSWIEEHRETVRGQEFDLQTEYIVAGETQWDETCTFIARKRQVSGDRRPAMPGEDSATTAPPGLVASSFRAPSGLGRRYGWISGDVNPIHMSDISARAFGFPRAIAHGMWSLARSAAEFGPESFAGSCEFEVSFKLPILLPSAVVLQRWPVDGGSEFALCDANLGKPYLTGRLRLL